MTNQDIIIIKNLQDGNVYTNEDIASLVGVDVSLVQNVDQYVTEDMKDYIIGDGSGVIYIMDIKYDTIVDGEGFRNTVYCAKCNMGCKGCHNPQSHDIHNGKPITINSLSELLLANGNDITFSGGECTLQCKAFIKLAKKLKERHKNIWLYSGHVFEDLINNKNYLTLLQHVDVLVDGKFDMSQQIINGVFKGSLNQRILDVKLSLHDNKGVLKYGY